MEKAALSTGLAPLQQQLAVQALGHVDARCRRAEALVRRHPHAPGAGRPVAFELDGEKRADQAFVVGCHGLAHGNKLDPLRFREGSRARVPKEHAGHGAADPQVVEARRSAPEAPSRRALDSCSEVSRPAERSLRFLLGGITRMILSRNSDGDVVFEMQTA